MPIFPKSKLAEQIYNYLMGIPGLKYALPDPYDPSSYIMPIGTTAVKSGAKKGLIEIGDWIVSSWGIPRGKVIGQGTIGKKIPAWKVNIGGGRITVLPKDEVKLWFKAGT